MEGREQEAALPSCRPEKDAHALGRMVPREPSDLVHDPVDPAHSPLAKRGGDQDGKGASGHVELFKMLWDFKWLPVRPKTPADRNAKWK